VRFVKKLIAKTALYGLILYLFCTESRAITTTEVEKYHFVFGR